jgi:UDP-GlcNAc:undecaprenyl-phosphate/decaprenyl-phosphate GlcNAc-1-phosphate transferase
MIALMTFLCALLITFSVTPLVHHLGKAWNILDQPDARKLHYQPMVRIGGLAIWCGTGLAYGLSLLGGFLPVLQSEEGRLILGVLLVSTSFFGIGFADDRWQLSPYWRLGLQAIVATLGWSMGIQIQALPIPGIGMVALGVFSLPITFLWLAGVANAINWVDGMDGLATGIGAIVSTMFALLAWQHQDMLVMSLALALAGACLGFWQYNRKPAQLYMGDGGSYFIGGLLAGIGVLSMSPNPEFTVNIIPYVMLAVPIIDMVLVMLARILNHKSIFFPDQRHIHHRLLQLGMSQQAVVFVIYGLTLWVGLSANYLLVNPWSWCSIAGGLGLLGVLNRTSLISLLGWWPWAKDGLHLSN